MDNLNSSGEVVNQALRELDFINSWLGGNAVTLAGVMSLLASADSTRTLAFADLGCGSGEMLRIISKRTVQFGNKKEFVGIDANPNIVAYAKKWSNGFPDLKFECLNIFSEEFRAQKFDIILTTLFLHHFSKSQLVILFRQLRDQARIGIVVNDIHRHPLAYHAIRVLTRLFSKSDMVKHDAPLSVLRAFKRNEIKAILAEAGIHNYSLTWKWAFRWSLIISSGTSA